MIKRFRSVKSEKFEEIVAWMAGDEPVRVVDMHDDGSIEVKTGVERETKIRITPFKKLYLVDGILLGFTTTDDKCWVSGEGSETEVSEIAIAVEDLP